MDNSVHGGAGSLIGARAEALDALRFECNTNKVMMQDYAEELVDADNTEPDIYLRYVIGRDLERSAHRRRAAAYLHNEIARDLSFIRRATSTSSSTGDIVVSAALPADERAILSDQGENVEPIVIGIVDETTVTWRHTTPLATSA